MAARAIAVLAAVACLLLIVNETRHPPHNLSPSRLEKSCPAGPFFVPCFTKDEALSQTWDV